MAYDVPEIEPTTHQAGTSLKFTRSYDDFPSDDWTLTYALRSPDLAPIDITASAGTGNDYSVSETMATTATWIAGDYEMIGYVTDGTDRHQVYKGTIAIARYAAGEGNYDFRSWSVRALEAVEAVLAGRLSRSDVSYSINGRSISHMNHEELFAARDRLKAEVAKEQQPSRPRKILVRFENAR